MPKQADEEEHVIVIREDALYGFTDIIEKLMHRKEPFVTTLLRRKKFTPQVYRIKNGYTNRLTDDYIEILGSERILWLLLTNDEAKIILGTNEPPKFKSYLTDLHKYLKRHDLAYGNFQTLYKHQVKHIPRAIQQRLRL